MEGTYRSIRAEVVLLLLCIVCYIVRLKCSHLCKIQAGNLIALERHLWLYHELVFSLLFSFVSDLYIHIAVPTCRIV